MDRRGNLGVFQDHAARAKTAPVLPIHATQPIRRRCGNPSAANADTADALPEPKQPGAADLPWSDLLRALTGIDLAVCPACHAAAMVYDLFVQVCPVVFPVNLADTDRAKEMVCGKRRASPRDALHAAVMLNNGIEAIATFDEDFDRITGVKRYRLT